MSSSSNGESTISSNSSNSEESSSSSSSSSTTPVVTKYGVNISVTSGITITTDKSQYAPLETVAVKVKASSGITVSEVKYNNKLANKVDDETYTFIMPNRSVTITCTASISGDMTIQGDALASFTQEGNIFVARNVKFNTGDGNFKVVISKDGSTSNVLFQEIDRTKCFADIEIPSNGYTGKLALGSTYDFYYDASNGVRPLYIKRVKVDTLPNSVNSLDSLFDGKVQSSDSAFPDNLTSVSVDSSDNDYIYSWQYDSVDNESLATLTGRNDKSKNYVYKKYDSSNQLFKWVDTSASNSGIVGKAGKYKVTNYTINAKGETGELNSDVDWDESRQYINPLLAPFEVSKNFKYHLYELEREFMYGYRVGMVVQDYVKSSSVSITSISNSSGTTPTGFTTTVVSSKTYDSSSATESGVTQEKIHYEYRATIDFGVAGEFKSIDYKVYSFDDSLYNFSADTFISGNADSNLSKGTIYKTLTATYTYSEDNDVDFDSSKYFISSIDSVVVNDPNAGTGNVLSSGNQLDKTNSKTGLLEYVTINATPSTALDMWQYGVTSSSDETVVRWNDSYRRYEADKIGTTELTISNWSTRDIFKKVNVEVAYTSCLRSIYLNANVYGADRDEYVTDCYASSATIYSGGRYKFRLGTSGNKPSGEVALPPDLTATASIDGISISFDLTKKDMIVDATNCNVSAATSFKITFASKYFLEADGVTKQTPSVLNFTIQPVIISNFSDIVGTYSYANGAATLKVYNSDDTITLNGKTGTYNKIDIAVGDDVYSIAYKINLTTGKITEQYVYDTSTKKVKSDYDLELTYANGNILDDNDKVVYTGPNFGVYLATGSWSGQDSTSVNEILGSSDEDEDYASYTPAIFTKVA